jgi:hypothetical protein
MDINSLTIGQAREIAAMFGLLQQQPAMVQPACPLVGQKVIVRAYRAGVHYGTLVSLDGECAVLSNARRLWFWQVADKKGISLSDVAEHGLSDESKVCAVVKTQVVIDACEIMTTTAIAQNSIEAKNDYKP